MEPEEPPSPPSRRHRRPPPPRKNRKSLSSSNKPQPVNDTSTTSDRRFTAVGKGKGKAVAALEVVQEVEEQSQRVNRSTTPNYPPPQANRPVASTSRVIVSIGFALRAKRAGLANIRAFKLSPPNPSSSLTPLDRLPASSQAQASDDGPTLSQLFSSDPVQTPYRPYSLLNSSRSRRRKLRSNLTSGSEEAASDYENPVTTSTGSKKRRRVVKKVRSARANRTMWTQIREGFGLEEDQESSEDSEDSVVRFRTGVLPLSTAIEKYRSERGGEEEEGEGENEENASEWSRPRKPFKRILNFLGGQELDTMSKGDKRKLLRKAPYRTKSTDALPLDFVNASQAGFDRDVFGSSPLRRRPASEPRPVEHVKRLPPGKSPRTPFLTISQTDFAPLAHQQLEGEPEPELGRLRPLTTFVSEKEAARISKKGSGWVSTKKRIGPSRVKMRSNKKALIMVREEEAQDTVQTHPVYPPKPRKARAVSTRTLRRRTSNPKFRFIPARNPPPVRPFALRPPPVLPRESHDETESIQATSTSNAIQQPPVPSRQPSPLQRQELPTPKAKKTEFRFIVGPKAKKAPTVLVEDTPPTDPRQQQPAEEPNPSLPHPDELVQGERPEIERKETEIKESTKKKQPLMRRLSTLPGGRFGVEEMKDSKEDAVAVEEPRSSFNRYNRSSHSNSQGSRFVSVQQPPLAAPSLPLVESTRSEEALPPAHQPTTSHELGPVQSSHPHQFGHTPSPSPTPTPSFPSSFEQDVFAALNAADPATSSFERPTDYFAALTIDGQLGLESTSREVDEVARDWWRTGPTFSAALREGRDRTGEGSFDLYAARRAEYEYEYSEGSMVESSGSMSESMRNAQAEEEDVANETEVWNSSLMATVGRSAEEEAGGRGGEGREEPPESILALEHH
ncbi:uncharacterized protein JCM6883_001422 [Sporobolomyces salmoneus]|uniref:uncharacterized protein n=1 Tax=Sporobolomyces salmoneus TaxID=183962 RepID=UPI003171FF4C